MRSLFTAGEVLELSIVRHEGRMNDESRSGESWDRFGRSRDANIVDTNDWLG
jgi:hypothetical protein